MNDDDPGWPKVPLYWTTILFAAAILTAVLIAASLPDPRFSGFDQWPAAPKHPITLPRSAP
jgi:hypothetical protein